MTVPGNIEALLLGGDIGYRIQRSLRFNSPDSAYLNRTQGSGTLARWTFSAWVKRTKLGSNNCLISSTLTSDPNNYTGYLFFDINNRLAFYAKWGTDVQNYVSTQVFRDVSAWYHIVLAVDLTLSAPNGVKMYVNGVQITDFFTSTYSNTFQAGAINNNYAHNIGRNTTNSSDYFDGYITETYFLNNQQLAASSFGETDLTTGAWKPKRYTGTYGTNGFYLNFADNSDITATTLGKDSSGNGNNWTPNNFSVTGTYENDSLIDVPTNFPDGDRGRGNYATLNPLTLQSPAIPSDAGTLSEGNLTITTHAGTGAGATGTMAVNLPTGNKWYCEVTPRSGVTGATNAAQIGILNGASEGFPSTQGLSYYSSDTTTYTDGDVIGIAYDGPANQVSFYKNGVLAKGPSAVVTSAAPLYPAARDNITSSIVFDFNFGQRPWAYAPPAGFLAMNTQNLPEPTIKKPSSYFDAKLYTGNGSTQTISGFGFSPDLVWIKSRSAATNNDVFDSVRGATVGFATNSTQPESTFSGVTAFNSNGFSLGSNTSDNANSATYVAWCWDESATPGFDIVTYTGTNVAGLTVAHSLGVAPRFVICKTRSESSPNTGWQVYHASLGATRALWLNSTAAAGTNINYWNNQAPTATLVRLGDNFDVNKNGTTYVMYAWAEVNGFSRFSSFTGNGYSDGQFVYCGFRPKFILIKNSTTGGVGYSWFMYDTARNTFNVVTESLLSDSSSATYTDPVMYIDILSNGFKIRGTAIGINQSSATLIFAAFAESPLKYSLAR